jgi:cytochrome b561
MSTPQVSRYHPLLVALHWVLALLIIADLTIGTLVLAHIPNDSPMKIEGLRAHMGGGVVILTLMLLRLWVRLATTVPAEARTGSAWLDRVAWWSHRLLYVVVIGMAGSGLVMGLQAHVPDAVFFGHGTLPASFWIYPLRSVHFLLSRLLMALISLHVAGALYHTLIRRDHLLRRMGFGRRILAGSDSAPAPDRPFSAARR